MELLNILQHLRMCMAPVQPTFDGSGNLQEFLQAFENYFEARGGDKVTVFGRCMRGEEAANWFEYCVTYEGDDWDTISRSFSERFGLKLRKDELIEELYTFSIARGESLYSYMERFAKYLRVCEANDVQTTVKHHMHFFIKGFKAQMPKLYHKLHKCVSRGELTSMKMLFAKAKNIVRIYDHLPEFDGALNLNAGISSVLINTGNRTRKRANEMHDAVRHMTAGEVSKQITLSMPLLGQHEVCHDAPSFPTGLSHAPSDYASTVEKPTFEDEGVKSQMVLDCVADCQTHSQLLGHLEVCTDAPNLSTSLTHNPDYASGVGKTTTFEDGNDKSQIVLDSVADCETQCEPIEPQIEMARPNSCNIEANGMGHKVCQHSEVTPVSGTQLLLVDSNSSMVTEALVRKEHDNDMQVRFEHMLSVNRNVLHVEQMDGDVYVEMRHLFEDSIMEPFSCSLEHDLARPKCVNYVSPSVELALQHMSCSYIDYRCLLFELTLRFAKVIRHICMSLPFSMTLDFILRCGVG